MRSFPYRLETPFAPAECCERLAHALANQPSVNVAENWLHRPQVVLGRVSVSEIMLYRGNAMVHSWIQTGSARNELKSGSGAD